MLPASSWKKYFDELYASSHNHLLITSTLTSDGDSIGAQVALYRMLQHYARVHHQPECKITLINQSPVPERYQFILKGERIITPSKDAQDIEKQIKEKGSFTHAVVLDGGAERIGDVKKYWEGVACKAIVDHHFKGSETTYQYYFTDATAASTTMILFEALDQLQVALTPSLAAPLYLGLIFDTGIFRHVNTNSKVLECARLLIDTGINFNEIIHESMLSKTLVQQKLMSEVLLKAELFHQGKMVVSVLTQNMFQKQGAVYDDADGIIEQLDFIQGVRVAFLLTELSTGETKISMRSKGNIDVSMLARNMHESGGGHKRASGVTLKLTCEEAKRILISKALQQYSDTLVC